MPDETSGSNPAPDAGERPGMDHNVKGKRGKSPGDDVGDVAKEIKREFRWFEWVSIGSNLILAVVGIFALKAYYGQLGAMKGQLTQMQGSSQQTDKLLGLYQQQLNKLDASIQQASRLAAATETANSNVLAADRPWFGASFAQQDVIEAGKIPSATIIFMNSGKRPARVTFSGAAVHWFDKFPRDPPYPAMSLISTELVVPGAGVTQKFNLAKQPLSQTEVDAVNTGKPARWFLYAKIEYVDVRTGENHHTHVCWVYTGNDPALAKGFYNCGEYQDAN